MSVLVVDDDVVLRDAVILALEIVGIPATGAGSRAEVMAALDSGVQADAFVLDLGLPDADGGDVARELRARGETVPIVGISGQRSRLRALYQEGWLNAILPKPFRVADIRRELAGARKRSD